MKVFQYEIAKENLCSSEFYDNFHENTEQKSFHKDSLKCDHNRIIALKANNTH